MRILPTLFLLFLIPCFVFSIGCQARRCATCTTCETSNSSYWADGVSHSEPAVADSESIPEKDAPRSTVEASGTWKLLAKAKSVLDENGDAACKSCSEVHDVLVDGFCAQCMKEKLNVNEVPNGHFTNDLVDQIQQKVSSRRKDDAIVSREIETADAPEKLEIVLDTESGKKLQLFPHPDDEFGQSAPKIPSKADVNKILNSSLTKSAAKGKVVAKLTKEQVKTEAVNLKTNTAKNAGERKKLIEYKFAKRIEERKEEVKTQLPLPNILTKPKPAVAQAAATISELDKQNLTGPDPRFETFKLEDLFKSKDDTKPQKPKSLVLANDDAIQPAIRKTPEKAAIESVEPSVNKNSNAKLDTKSPAEKEKIKFDPPAVKIQKVARSRSEEEVIRDLRNSTIPTKVVFDNPTKAPQSKQVAEPEILLKARPVEYYHEFQKMIEQQKQETGSSNQHAEKRNKNESLPKKVQRKPRVPTRQVSGERVAEKQQEVREQYDFRPLPQLNEIVEPIDLSKASSISNEVYQPYEFPEEIEIPGANQRAEIQLRSLAPSESSSEQSQRGSMEFHPLPATNNVPIFRSITPVETPIQPLPPVDRVIPEQGRGIKISALPKLPTNNVKKIDFSRQPSTPKSILLRAIPMSKDESSKVELPNLESQSKARFRFNSGN